MQHSDPIDNIAGWQELAAPLYAQMLAEAAKRLGPTPAYYALWPGTSLAQPWARLAARLYAEVRYTHQTPVPVHLALSCKTFETCRSELEA